MESMNRVQIEVGQIGYARVRHHQTGQTCERKVIVIRRLSEMVEVKAADRGSGCDVSLVSPDTLYILR
jgi:hypothetical protein